MAPSGNDDRSRGDGQHAGRAAVRQALGAVAGLLRVGILAVDAEGRCWFRSQRWEDRSGTAGFGDRPWFDGVHPDDRQAVAARWEALLGRRGRLGSFRTVGVDGSISWCRAESVPMLSPDGQRVGYLVLVTDAGDLARSDDAGATGATGPTGSGVGATGATGSGVGATGATGPTGSGVGVGEGRPMLSAPKVLDAALEVAPDIITIFNADGSWRWSSGAALRLLGHQAEFDPATGVFGLLHPDDVELAQRAFERALDGHLGPDERLEVRLRAGDGSWRDMECLIDVLLDEPSVHGVVVHARDVTEARRVLDELEATNRRLADLITSMKAAVLVEDEHGAVVLVNQAFVDLFHLDVAPDELVGEKLSEVTDFSLARMIVDPPDVAHQVQELRRQGRRLETGRAVLFDGRTIECDFVPTRAQGAARGNLWMVRDVTRRARAEAERERLLASEREENRRLAEMDVFRSESLAAVSHELRTPLTSIVGYTGLLRNMIDPTRHSEEAECLEAISRNVDRLLRLAGDVVALDTLESRTLPLEVGPVDVGAAVRQAATTVAPQAAEKQIEVVVDVAGARSLRGDGDRLVQLFENLLSNAVKFTPSGGRVSASARPDRDGWWVEVADTGIGIPEDELEHLFARFFRGSNARTRGIPGSGLGLSVARAIAERHRGGIEVRSDVGAGTTVAVSLRDAPDEEHWEVATTEQAGGG